MKRPRLEPTRQSRGRAFDRPRRPAKIARELAALKETLTQTKALLDAEILRNATPVMSMKAAAGYTLIVECENFSMRVRTRGVVVKASKDGDQP